ncbi:MAG: hypothetical protein AAF266_03970 [Planctomycetota bacterium]
MAELIGRLLECLVAVWHGIEWLWFAVKNGEEDNDWQAATRLIARLTFGFFALIMSAIALYYLTTHE